MEKNHEAYRMHRAAFQAGKRKPGAPVRSAAPNLSAVLRVLRLLAWFFGLGGERRVYGWWGRSAWQQVGRWQTFVLGKEIGCAERAESSSAEDWSLRGPGVLAIAPGSSN